MEINHEIKNLLEAALMAAGEPVSLERLGRLFSSEEQPPSEEELRAVLLALTEEYHSRGIALKEVASGFVLQVRSEYSQWVQRLWDERTPRYSRALLETLAIIVYKQPVTRGDMEAIRGVVVSPNILKTLLDHDWIKVVGHKEVPGRPALYASTQKFLDAFHFKSLEELPSLASFQNDPIPEELAELTPEDLGLRVSLEETPESA